VLGARCNPCQQARFGHLAHFARELVFRGFSPLHGRPPMLMRRLEGGSLTRPRNIREMRYAFLPKSPTLGFKSFCPPLFGTCVMAELGTCAIERRVLEVGLLSRIHQRACFLQGNSQQIKNRPLTQ